MGSSWEAQASVVAGARNAPGGLGGAEFEEGDRPEDLLRDELAAKLVACGAPPAMAQRYVEGVLAVFREKDAALSAEARGAEEQHGFDVMRLEATFREQLRSIAQAERPKLMARVYLMARGVETDQDESVRKLAAAYNLSPQAVKNMVDDARASLRLPKNQFNKSDEACANYRLTNRRNIRHGDKAGH